jgi:hypothetical protein
VAAAYHPTLRVEIHNGISALNEKSPPVKNGGLATGKYQLSYTTSIFALARSCLARAGTQLLVLALLQFVFRSDFTSANGFFGPELCAFSRMMVNAVSI